MGIPTVLSKSLTMPIFPSNNPPKRSKNPGLCPLESTEPLVFKRYWRAGLRISS